jgi:hypothetical protein
VRIGRDFPKVILRRLLDLGQLLFFGFRQVFHGAGQSRIGEGKFHDFFPGLDHGPGNYPPLEVEALNHLPPNFLGQILQANFWSRGRQNFLVHRLHHAASLP